jgi:hypothetical protein
MLDSRWACVAILAGWVESNNGIAKFVHNGIASSSFVQVVT